MAEASAQQANSAPDAGSIDGLMTIDALDRRTRAYRRFVSIRASIYEDLGGEDALSEVQRQLISKFATLALTLEVSEAATLAGQPIDPEAFGRAAGHLRRVAEVIGLKRQPRDVTDLGAYLATRSAGGEAAA